MVFAFVTKLLSINKIFKNNDIIVNLQLFSIFFFFNLKIQYKANILKLDHLKKIFLNMYIK
jgi:hypothetical protein